MPKNKVKFNVKNVHYALLTETEEGTITYGAPVAIPGARSLSMDAQGDLTKWYADGMVYYTTAANNGYDGSLEVAMFPESFRTDVLGETLDEKKVLVENANVEPKRFALLFEFDGDQKGIRHVMYNCVATRPAVSGNTVEESKEPETETANITASPLSDGRVKAKTSDSTDEATYSNWYKNVYVSTKEA
jgi:phi13 family phage major tail protein